MAKLASLDVPAHVPPHLVYDFDFFSVPPSDMPQWDLAKTLLAEAPPIFFTPCNGGHWVVTRAIDTVRMFRNYEMFSNDPQYHPVKAENPTRHLPLFYDPPEHTDARKLIAPHFTPGAVQALEPYIRQVAIRLIDKAAADGCCEFVGDVAAVFPVDIFFQMTALPMEHREALQHYVSDYMRSDDAQIRQVGMRKLISYMQDIVEERRKSPGSDVISQIVNASFLGRELTPMEALSAAATILIAGLDTVVSLMSFIIAFLARNPELYGQLVDEPAIIPGALEELMRINSSIMPERACTHDAVVDGIAYKKFDRVVFMLQVQGVTDDRLEDPFVADFRRDLFPHLNFGAGFHRCAGSHLARLELRVFLEEWVKHVSGFNVTVGRQVSYKGGTIWMPDSLPLTFTSLTN